MAKNRLKRQKKDLQKEIDKTVKLFDVAKPGETPPDATSRPVIVGHTAMLKRDPMVREKADPDEAPAEVPVISTHTATVINPDPEPAPAEKKKQHPKKH